MLKILMLVIIIISTSSIGILKYWELKDRYNLLIQFRDMVYKISLEIDYFKEPLPALFKKIDHPFALEISNFINLSNFNFQEAFNNAMCVTYQSSSLITEDLNIMEKLGCFLGQSDWKNQKMQFDLLLTELDCQISEAKTSVKEKGKLYKKIGIYSGLIIGILFI